MPMASPQIPFAVSLRVERVVSNTIHANTSALAGQAQRPLPRPPQHHHFLGALSLWERLHFAPKRHCPFLQK